MYKVKSRVELGEWCLRKLGAPVIQINVADEQVEDRIEEALEVYQEKHYDATEELWVAKEVTASDAAAGYISLPDDILVVAELGGGTSSKGSSDYKFSYEFQIRSQLFSPYSSFSQFDIADYYIVNTAYGDILNVINTTPRFEHSRHGNRLHIFNGKLVEGSIIYMRVFKVIDPEINNNIYNDKWLKAYTTQLIKKQWGENMKKHDGVQLLGGVTINGTQIYNEAVEEINILEQKLIDEFSEPVDFFVG